MSVCPEGHDYFPVWPGGLGKQGGERSRGLGLSPGKGRGRGAKGTEDAWQSFPSEAGVWDRRDAGETTSTTENSTTGKGSHPLSAACRCDMRIGGEGPPGDQNRCLRSPG